MPNRSTKGDPRESALDKSLRVIYRLISELKINPKNPRTHSRRQIQQIARSLKAFGFIVPVLIDAWGNVIAGHGRILAGISVFNPSHCRSDSSCFVKRKVGARVWVQKALHRAITDQSCLVWRKTPENVDLPLDSVDTSSCAPALSSKSAPLCARLIPPATAAPRSSVACRRTTAGSDALRPTATSSNVHA
jgi:hypothetical protein